MSDGDPATQDEVLSQVYHSTLPEIYGYLLRRLDGQKQEAEEVTQETYLALVQAMRSGVTIERPGAWLQVVARNKLVDHLRRQDRRRDGTELPTSDQPVVTSSRVDAEALLHELPAAQRAAMILHYLDDLPVAEVAKVMNRSVRAVESLLARGRRALSQQLDGRLP